MYIDRKIEDIVENNSMNYAQYVIKNRALPDLYSGMKPIHLKILWSMFENKTFNFTKSANVSGKVMVYSPHGDCYETIVNMVQKDRHIYNLIEGQGNWGSSCSTEIQFAASRYTECKMSSLGIDCMQGISKNMVEMIDNYDSSSKMPKYLPTRFPLILCMASNGIAVGMANNSPSFNLEDVCNATILYLQGKEIPMLIADFATGGYVIANEKETENINLYGTGTIKLRAKYKIEDNVILINEIPYGTKISVESIIDRIIEKHKSGELKEITNVLNQTGVNGLCIEITCKKGTNMEMLMEKLYKLTPLESNFSVNMNVLLEGSPMVLGVHDTIKEWVKFRQRCISNGLQSDIDKLERELHILNGLKKVLLDIDKTVSIIRYSDNIESELMDYFKIDEIQADNIINIKLKNINKGYIIKQISDIDAMKIKLKQLKETINNPNAINNIIIEDLQDIIKKFKQPRRTQLIHPTEIIDITKEDLIEEYNCKILYTSQGYIKKFLKSSDKQYLKENDEIIEEIQSTNKSTLYLITNNANRYKLPCYELEEKKPSQLGEYISNIISLEDDEEVIKIVSVDENKSKGYILAVYQNGKISKVDIKSFISNNKKLQNCYSTESKLVTLDYIEKDCDVFLVSDEGKSLIINTKKISKKNGRRAQGNIAMNLDGDNKIIASIINPATSLKFTLITEKGKEKEYYLDNIAPTGKPTEERSLYQYISGNVRNSGTFILNMRNSNDKVKQLAIGYNE